MENLYVHEDIAILTMGDSKTFMEKVEEELEQKPEWENNIYLQIADISSSNKEIVILYRYDEDCGNEFYYANKSNVKILFYSK